MHSLDKMLPLSPAAIAAAWNTWKERHEGKLGPGPGFREAVEAAIRAQIEEIRKNDS